MISRADLNLRSHEWGLRLDIVEKDYVIGWLLCGIGSDPVLRDAWVFKGGTCLKKCYIETYRFSEDLDFTVMPDGPVAPDDVRAPLERVLDRVAEVSGIDFSVAPPKLRARPDGGSTEGRVYYRGPLGTPSPASIKLDLSRLEPIVRPTVLKAIAHVYPDTLPQPGHIRCYAFEELFAEKIRAMGERGRPRDLYDIVNLYRRHDLRRHGTLIAEVLVAKCAAKGISVPTFASIVTSPYGEQLASEWHNMLSHQLPALPPFERFWAELPALFDWLAGQVVEPDIPLIPSEDDEDATWAPPPTVWVWGGAPLEPVRYAASNRLCVELGYRGSTRLIEPYPLRRTRAGNLLLYALKHQSRVLQAYRVDRIESVRVTMEPFTPSFVIELGAGMPLIAPPTRRTSTTRRRSARQATTALREAYTVECTVCGRSFSRTTPGTNLRKHKDPDGNWCPGRKGRRE